MAKVPPSVAIWKASTKETVIRQKKTVLVFFWNWKLCLYSSAGWPWDPEAGVSCISFYGCAPSVNAHLCVWWGDAILIRLEVRVYQQAWPLTTYKTHPSSPRLYSAYLLISLKAEKGPLRDRAESCRPNLVCRSVAEPIKQTNKNNPYSWAWVWCCCPNLTF